MQAQLGKAGLVWAQNPISLSKQISRPQPDIALLKWRDDIYAAGLPQVEDVLLIIEVAYSTLDYDRSTKATLYAESGIPEYWVVNLLEAVVEIYSQPAGSSYKHMRRAMRGETLPLPGRLQVSIAVTEILG